MPSCRPGRAVPSSRIDRALGVVERAVLEALRQLQPDLAVPQVGHVRQRRARVGKGGPAGGAGGVAGDESEERAADESAARGRGGPAEHGTTVEV